MGRSAAVILLWGVLGCSSPSEDIMAQAGEIHDLSLMISEQVTQKISFIEQYIQNVPGSEKAALLDSVKVLRWDLASWKEGFIEVPGHDHDHGHAHHHGPPRDLTPEMVLEIQQETRDRIIQLNIRVQRLLEILKNEEEYSKDNVFFKPSK